MSNKRILERYNSLKLGWLHDSMHFIVAFLALLLVFNYVIGLSFVSGDSMYPTLKDGDLVVYLRPSDVKPGDIVSIRVPSGDYYIKRVIAAGGDSVDLQDGIVLVNGVPYADTYAYGVTEEETGAIIFPYKVREGNVFVLGDNRTASLDSRAFGEINRRQIKGKILLGFTDGKLKRY